MADVAFMTLPFVLARISIAAPKVTRSAAQNRIPRRLRLDGSAFELFLGHEMHFVGHQLFDGNAFRESAAVVEAVRRVVGP